MTDETRAALTARMLDMARGSLCPMPVKPYVTIETFARFGHYRVRLWRTSRTRGLALLELQVPVES